MKIVKQMIIKLISNILYLFVLKGILFSQGLDDIQFWHAEKFQKKINEKTLLSLEQDFRSGENMSKLLYLHADFGFRRSLNKSYSINLNFREVFEQKGQNLTREHRPHVQIAWKGKSGQFSISSRARLEYRIRQGKDSVFRNRDMISVNYGKGFTSLKLVPYFANEFFYDFEKNEYNRNRFYVGIKVGSIKSFKPTIYILIQTKIANDSFTHIGVLGFKFNF